jgi:hypothetical protein
MTGKTKNVRAVLTIGLFLGAVLFCCFLLKNTRQTQWMDAHTSSELSKVSFITKEQLNATEQFLRDKNCAFVRIKIENKKIDYFLHTPTDLYQKRIAGFKRLFNQLQASNRLVEADLIVILDDGVLWEFPEKDLAPVFCISKLKSQSRVFCIPEIHAYPDIDRAYERILKASSKKTWNKKLETAFWRGGTTGGYYTSENWMTMLRTQLVLFSKTMPECFDCAFNTFIQGDPNTESIMRGQELFAEGLSRSRQAQYKYLISIDGNTFPSSLKWQLFSGSVVLRNESEWVEWYDSGLIPFEHYVPYKPDFSDLLGRVIWLKNNDAIAQKIARQAKKFARENLTSKGIELYVYKLLAAYSQKFIQAEGI